MEIDFGPLDTALEIARARGASDAEAYSERSLGLTVKVFDGRVEKFSYSETMGLGLRVVRGARMGRAYTTDPSPDSIAEAVAEALSSAKVSPEDPHRVLPGPESFPPGADECRILGEDLGIWSEDLAWTSPGEKIEFALGLERVARQHDARVIGVETAVYGEESSQVLVASTRGIRSGLRSSECYGYLVAMAEQDTERQTGFGFTAGRSFESLDMLEAAEEAASTAVALLGGRQAETAKVPVLFDNLSTAEILSFVAAALSAEAVVKGRSFLAGKVGERVAHESLCVVDDALMPGGFGTAPFDGEGVAGSKKTPISQGMLTTFLHNSYTASRTGETSTGNAGRKSFRDQVGVMPTNLFIPAGTPSRESLRSSMERGLEVLSLQGVNIGFNPVTGEVSVGAKGLWVEGGRRAFPVREVTIAGTLTGILEGMVGIGDDVRFTPLLGGIGTPSVLVEGLVVSGK